MKKKIAVIAYTTFSTDTRVQKEAFAALDAGYQLDIYTLEDKYISNYGKFNFIHSHISQYKGHSRFKYIFSYLKFFLFCFFQLSANSFSKKYKYIHVHNMPNFLVFSTLIPKILGSKVVLDIHDLMPEIFSVKFKLDIKHPLIRLLYMEEKLSANFSNEIIATNSFHIERFKKNGIVNKKITEIINVADEKIFYKPDEKNFYSEELVLGYPSTLAKRLGIDNLIDAVEILKSKKLKIRLKIFGDGEYRSEIVKLVYKKKLESIIDLSDSFISLEKLSFELDKVHVGVIPLPNNVSNNIAMPVKIYEFFAKQICVVTTELPLLKSNFENYVIFFEPSNSIDLANKIEELYLNRNKVEEFATKGFQLFKKQTWKFYKEKYQNIIS